MTRKDFIRLAQGLNAVRNTMAEIVFEQVVDQIALACQDCADKTIVFDYDKFVDACNTEPDPFP